MSHVIENTLSQFMPTVLRRRVAFRKLVSIFTFSLVVYTFIFLEIIEVKISKSKHRKSQQFSEKIDPGNPAGKPVASFELEAFEAHTTKEPEVTYYKVLKSKHEKNKFYSEDEAKKVNKVHSLYKEQENKIKSTQKHVQQNQVFEAQGDVPMIEEIDKNPSKYFHELEEKVDGVVQKHHNQDQKAILDLVASQRSYDNYDKEHVKKGKKDKNKENLIQKMKDSWLDDVIESNPASSLVNSTHHFNWGVDKNGLIPLDDESPVFMSTKDKVIKRAHYRSILKDNRHSGHKRLPPNSPILNTDSYKRAHVDSDDPSDDHSDHQYHENSDEHSENDIIQKTSDEHQEVPPCYTLVKPRLTGKITYPSEITGTKYADSMPSWESIEDQSNSEITDGCWKPPSNLCIPDQYLAVIVPYRNRDHHLRFFTLHMHQILQRQLRAYCIILAEQEDHGQFNRAKLMNVGYLAAVNHHRFFKDRKPDCFSFHDVDLLPDDDRNVFACLDHAAIHQCDKYSKYEYTTQFNAGHLVSAGGALLVSRKHYSAIKSV